MSKELNSTTMKNLMTTFFVFGALLSQGQLQTLTAVNTTVGSGGVVQFNNFAELGQKDNNKIAYSDVAGNCFWKKEWTPAVLVLRSGKTVKLKNVKLNFYSNDVHYLDAKGSELIAQSKINKVIFTDPTDSLKTAGIFRFEPGHKIKGTDFFVQVFNEGKVQLLKRVEVKIIKRDSSPMQADRVDLKFLSDESYYLGRDGNLLPLKKISKKNIFELIKVTSEDAKWLTDSQNKLKNEEDAIAFLNYYNSSAR
jgi:hypothetical protein